MAQETGVVQEVVPETPLEDQRGFFDKVGDTLGEYVDQGVEFATDIYDNFSKLDSTDTYKLEGTDLYSQEIQREADKTTLDRALEATGDFFQTALVDPIKSLYEGEDAIMKKLTGTDIFRNQQSADTANEVIKNFYARNDVQNEKDPNKQYALQQELYDSLKPFIKPEKAISDDDIVKAIDELSISKQQQKYQKELADNKLKGIIDEEVQSTVNKKFVGGESFYNQGLIESFKRGASQELTEVLEMKKDLQISALEMGIDKTEVEERIARLDKIIDIKKRQISNGLEIAFKDPQAFEDDGTGRLKIYNKAMEGLSDDEVKTLIDYERNDTKDLNTLLNVNRLNQLKKGGVLDRMGAGLSGLQGTVGLTFDTLDSALGIKTLLGGAIGRNYSVDDRESMLNALQSDENYLSMANRVGGSYVLFSALSNFDDIGQVMIGGGITNKASGINKVTNFLDGVTGRVKGSLATGAKGLVESYAYNNQLSMSANELGTDDYQVMNALIDPFAENVMNFIGYMSRNTASKLNMNYFDLGAARRFKQYMIENGDESTKAIYNKKDIELIRDELNATNSLIKNNHDKARMKEILKTPETIAEYGRILVEEIKTTGGATYKGDGFIVSDYLDSVQKAGSPAYIFQNSGTIINSGKKYLNEMLVHYANNPDKVIYKGMDVNSITEVKTTLGTIKDGLNKLGTVTDIAEKNAIINDINNNGYKIYNSIKGVGSESGQQIVIFNKITGDSHLVGVDNKGVAKYKEVRYDGNTKLNKNDFMYQESKLNKERYLRLKQLVDGTYVDINKTDNVNIARQIEFDLGLKSGDIGTGNENKILRVETISDNTTGGKRFKLTSNNENVKVSNILSAQKGMQRAEIIGLLKATKDGAYSTVVKDLQDMEETLNRLMPIISGTVFDNNPIQLRNFKNASRLFLSSNLVLGLLKQLSGTNSANETILENILINAAIKMADKPELVGNIMGLADDTIGMVTKAELISGIFTGVIKPNIKDGYYDDVLKQIGAKSLVDIVGKSNKEFKRVEKVFNKIEDLFGYEGKSFRNQFMDINKEIFNRLVKENLSDDVLKVLDKDYISIYKTVFEYEDAFKKRMNGFQELFGIKGSRTMTGLNKSLKSKLKEAIEKKDNELVKKLEFEINKIENGFQYKLGVESRLDDVIRNIKLIDVSNVGVATKEFINIKAELQDILKDVESNLTGEQFDEVLIKKLKNVYSAYVDKKLSNGSGKQQLSKYFEDLVETVEKMDNGLGQYTGYIKPDGTIANFGDTPPVSVIKSILSFKPEDKLIRYYGPEYKAIEFLKDKYDVDIVDIRSTSMTEGEFHFKLLNTKAGEYLLNMFPPASMDVEPLSVQKILDEVDGVDSFLDKIKVLDNYILNIQKYFLSRGIMKDTNRVELTDSLLSVKAHYLSLATFKQINKYPNKGESKFIEFQKEVLIQFNEGKSIIEILENTQGKFIQFLAGSGGADTSKFILDAIGSGNISKFIRGSIDGKQPIEFHKAQSILNKELLNGTPLDLVLKKMGIDYDKIAETIISKGDIKVKGKLISDYIIGTENKVIESIFGKTNEEDITKLLSNFTRNIFGGFKEGLADKANNYVLENIIDNLPRQFTNRLIVSTDFDSIKNLIGFLESVPALSSIITKVGKDKLLQFVDEIRVQSDSLLQATYKTTSDTEGQNELINGLIKVITDSTDDIELEGGKTLKKVLEENDKEIRHNISNALRSISEFVGRDIVELDGLFGKKTTGLVDHSDGINQIYSLKYLVDINLKGGLLNKYDKVLQYDFTENFYRQITNGTDLSNSEAKTLFVTINNIKYISKKLGNRDETIDTIEWKDIGFDKTRISTTLFDKIYKYSGNDYIAMPTSGEEAGRGYAINPNEELIKRLASTEISLGDGSRVRVKSITQINKYIDNEIFSDVKKVLELDPSMSQQDFAKRLKGKLAGGSGILRKEEEILSIQLKDPILVGFYGVDKTIEDINGSYNKDRLKSILESKGGESELTDKEINKISELLNSQGYVTNGTIDDKTISFKDLVTDDLKSILDKAKLINDTRIQDGVKSLTSGLDFSNKDKLLDNISIFKNDFRLNLLSKEIKNEVVNLLNESEALIKSAPAEGKIIKGTTGLDLKTLLRKDALFAKKAYVYLLSVNNTKVKGLLIHGLKDSKLETFQTMMEDSYGKDTFNVVADFFTKEPTDGMGYMSRDMAIAIYEDRAFKKYDERLGDEVLPDLKSHMLDDGVFEKSRQSALSKEMDSYIREKLGIGKDQKFVMSFSSAIKTGKKTKYKKFPKEIESSIDLYGTKVEVVGKRMISSNQIKLAASDAVTDKDKVTISMQYLAGLDPVLFQGLQNVSINKAITKVQKEGDKFKLGKVMSDNRGVHNLRTLDEMIKNNETELFNTLKGMTTDGSMLKLTGEPRYQPTKGGAYEDLKPNTAYVSEYKFKDLLDNGKIKSIGKDINGKEQYAVLAFRNPVPSPYNVSLLKLEIDYSLRGKNLKIHHEDTFLKKEADFDADTVNLILEGDNSFTYKTLFLSSLKQTNLDYKHGITFREAQGNAITFENRVNEEYIKATSKLNDSLNKEEFFNKYVPTAQVGGVRPGMEKSTYATQTMQGALVESAVAKEEIGIVSVSQEWLYYILNSITEYSETGNPILGGTPIGNISIDTISKILDPNANDFYAQFASILQKTLDYAKSEEKFDPKWLDNEIKSLMRNPDNEEELIIIKDTLEGFAKQIKRFKNIELKDFKLEDIENLPPVLRDRYTMVRKGLDQIDDLKLKQGELRESYRLFYLERIPKELKDKIVKVETIKDEQITQENIGVETLIKEYFDKGIRMPLANKDALLENLFSKDHPAYVFYKNFNLTDITEFGNKQIYFEEGTEGYKALYSLLQSTGKKNFNSIDEKYYQVTLSDNKIYFNYDQANFNYMFLVRKYGDSLVNKKKVSISEGLGYQILGYNNVEGLIDDLKKTSEVVANMKLLSSMTATERKAVLESKGVTNNKINELENIIADQFDAGEYKFIQDITGINSYSELKDINSKIDLDIIPQGENFELTFNKIERGIVDDIINEVEFKGNVSNSLRRAYNNIDGYTAKREPISSFIINSEGRIVNTESIDINGESFIPNTINISNRILSIDDPAYRNDIMKYAYQLNPANAIITMNELEDIARIIGDKNSWNMFDKLMRFTPKIGSRIAQRDMLDGLGLRRLLDGTLEAAKGKKLDDKWKKIIENNIFINATRGKTIPVKTETLSIEDGLSITEITDLKNYEQSLRQVLVNDGSLNDMINKLKYNSDKLESNHNKSYLLNFLEIENGQHTWVLDEFGLKSMDEFERYVKESNPNINESELQNLSRELYGENNKGKVWNFIRKIKSNMYVLAFSPILVPAALAVTLLQMVPDFFINISKRSKSFNDPRVDALIRQYKMLDSETIRHSKNLHDTMDKSILQTPGNWVGNVLRSISSNNTWKELVSNIELIASNGFAANDVILGPLRRKVAATRAFDTIVEQYGGVDKFFARFNGDPEGMEKAMNIIRPIAHSNFIDLSGGSSTSKLSQTTVFSSNIHNIWNFMQTWSTSMVNQHVKASSNLHQSVRYLINGDKKKALAHFTEFSEYLSGQLRTSIAISAALAKYQMVFNENRKEDGEYDVMSYIKVLNNTIAGLESFSPFGALTGTLNRLDANNGMMYNLAAMSEEITGRFGREFNLPKNLVQYVSHAIKAGVPPEKILDGAYDILNDRTNGFMRYNKFELQDGYFQDTYTTNLFGTAMGVNDFTSYQEFKDNVKKYGSQRAFEELSTQGQLGVILGSSNYIKMLAGIYSDDGSFKVYSQVVQDILDIRNKDKNLVELISNGMNKEILDEIMLNNGKLDKDNIENIFYDLVNYSAKGLGESIESESGVTAFQWAKNPKGANVIDNLVVSKLHEKYGKEIVDAIAQNDYLTISQYIKNKVGPDMLKDLVPTGSANVDEAALRKMLLIAGEKSELTIPTIVSTLIYDKAWEFEKAGFNETQAKYKAIQMYGSLANGNLGMVNDVANVYTTKKYKEQLKPLFNNSFKEQFSKSLENKLLVDMAVGRAMYEEGDVGSAELRGDMTTIFNTAYVRMKENNNGILSKEDAMKLMGDYTYIDTQLNKLNGKVDPLKLFNYREGVFLSLLNKPDVLAEIENDDSFSSKWSDVKDNLTHRFLKFTGERKNYELDSFEEMVKDKLYKQIGIRTGSGSGGGGYSSLVRPAYKPSTGGGQAFKGGGGQPFMERAMNRGINPTSQPRDMFRANPYSFVPSMGGPKAYYSNAQEGFKQMYKQMYEQFSKDLVKRNPEYMNKIYSIKKMGSEFVGMKSKFIRQDYAQIPRIRYSQLSKGLIPGWAYRREI